MPWLYHINKDELETTWVLLVQFRNHLLVQFGKEFGTERTIVVEIQVDGMSGSIECAWSIEVVCSGVLW